ncbi:MAG: putative membrane protein [Maribacter sp.]|jgi:uncharacterized membrane protein
MAKKKKSNSKNESNAGKRVVVNTSTEASGKKKLQPTLSKKSKTAAFNQEPVEMLFGKENFILIGAGFALILIGMLLMAGGHQDPNEWNAEEVYSKRRTMIAPLFILAGLVTELVAIFKKKSVA